MIHVNTGGTLQATNSLIVASGGTLLVDGTVDAATKTVTNHGSIVANGTLTAGSLVIASDGALIGSSVGAASVNAPVSVSGRVSPSTATGKLNVLGPVTFGTGSTLEVEMGPSGTSDQLAVTNAVTIAPGARLVIVADPTTFGTAPSTATVLSASAISGQFTATDYAFLDETFDYQPTLLRITLTKTAQTFAPFARTPNQLAVARTLDAASPGATGDLKAVFDALYSAQSREIAPLLDAIGGESLTAFATARQILAERTARALQRRTRDNAWGEGRAFYLAPAGAPEPEADVSAGIDEDQGEAEATPAGDRVRAGAWFDALGTYGELEGNTGEAEVDTLLYGGTLGADAWISDRVKIGLAAGYARSDVDLDGRDSDVYGDTIQGALYGGYSEPRGYLSAYGRYAYTYQTSHRSIESSALRRQAHAHWDAHDYGAGMEAGLTVASFGGFALQPIAGFDWLQLTEDSFTENGAGALSLTVDPKTLDTTTSRLGARVFGRGDMDKAGVLTPELRAFWQRAYGDRERVLDARLSSAPGLSSIGVRGPELPRDTAILGVGWGVLLGANVTVSFDYDAVVGPDRLEHQGTVAARVRF